MGTVTDYASLTTAIADHTHRSDLTSGGTPFSDYFIQQAQEQINKDVFDKNFGNGIRLMEATYAVSNITGGTLPIPSDWLTPKAFQVMDGGGDWFPLTFKAATWLYNRYQMRQAIGLPAYIARDVQNSASFTGVIASNVLTVSALTGFLQTGMILAGSGLTTTPSNAVMLTQQLTGTAGSTGTYQVASCNPIAQTINISSEAMTSGGNVFVFGPYPDSAYQVQGTYYAKAALLSSGNTTNWMVVNAPDLLLSACLRKAGRFLKDPNALTMWKEEYEGSLEELVAADKAERWASSTLQVEVS